MTPPAESVATPATATENDLATNVARYFCAERMLLHETPSGERLLEQSEPESSPAVATEPHVPRILPLGPSGTSMTTPPETPAPAIRP